MDVLIIAGLVLVAGFVLIGQFTKKGRSSSRPTDAPRPPSQTRRASAGQAPSSPKEHPALRTFNANREWLKSRWSAANQQSQAGDAKDFPKWYFDPVTDRQLERIASERLELSTNTLTKGQASDIIGLFEPAEEQDVETLKFFKVPLAGMNQTRARVEVQKLMADPKNVEAWRNKPPDALQRECLKFYGVAVPKGLTGADASRLIAQREAALGAEGSPLPEEWGAFSSIIEEFSDRENCEMYGIKKPALSVVRAAVDALRTGGRTLTELEEDFDFVAQKIIEMKPELEGSVRNSVCEAVFELAVG